MVGSVSALLKEDGVKLKAWKDWLNDDAAKQS